MKIANRKLMIAAICLMSLFVPIASPASDTDVLPEGSCIYSGNTNRTYTAVAYGVDDVDFSAYAVAWVDDTPLDAFAYFKAVSPLLRFSSFAPLGFIIYFK